MTLRIVFLVLLAWVLASAAAGQNQTEEPRLITGSVITQENQAVPDTNVCAQWNRAMLGRVPCAKSDGHGRFAITVPRAGSYQITVENAAAGYPDSLWYGNEFCQCPNVTVEEANDPTPVTVRVGPKAGRVRFTIIDADTEQPIETGLLRICRPGFPKSCWAMSTAFPGGKYELLTPSWPFTIKFETSREGEWIPRYAFDESGGLLESMQVPLGEHKEVTVRLK